MLDSPWDDEGPRGAKISSLTSRIEIPRYRISIRSPAPRKSPHASCEDGGQTTGDSLNFLRIDLPIVTCLSTLSKNVSTSSCVERGQRPTYQSLSVLREGFGCQP